MSTSAPVSRSYDELPEMLSVRQAAEVIGVSGSVLYEEIAAGRFTLVTKIGKRMKVPLRRLLRWIDESADRPMEPVE